MSIKPKDETNTAELCSERLWRKAAEKNEQLQAEIDELTEIHNAQAICAEQFATTMADNQRLRDALEVIRQAGDTPNRWQWDCIIAREALEVGSVLELTTGVK